MKNAFVILFIWWPFFFYDIPMCLRLIFEQNIDLQYVKWSLECELSFREAKIVDWTIRKLLCKSVKIDVKL